MEYHDLPRAICTLETEPQKSSSASSDRRLTNYLVHGLAAGKRSGIWRGDIYVFAVPVNVI
eukprot:scaffold5363_cov113-Skeletonema_dohrnii-CCMP3373.AAC.3